MSERKQEFFTTGEFARLCGTTKDTLFYYDRIGILRPAKKRENGYRAYTAEQFFDYDLIRVLRQTGSTLEEIRDYLANYNTGHFLKLFREKREQIAAQRLRLEQMEQMLEHAIDTTERALLATYDAPYLEWQPEETLLLVRLDAGEGDEADRVAVRLAEHFAQCERFQVADKFPLGSVILHDEVCAGGEMESYFFSRVPTGFAGGELMQKPAGTYATVIHSGSYESFSVGYQLLLEYIHTHGWAVSGNAYVYDMVSYLASAGEQSYVFQISIEVKPDDSNASLTKPQNCQTI